MAEEDILFGKNRHMFGGIEPSNMIQFLAVSMKNEVKIFATLPEDTTLNGQTLCSVAGAVIRKKTGDYPVDEFDGEGVAVISESGVLTDPDVETGNTYYYAAFPYTTQGVYARSIKNRTQCTVGEKDVYIYGYDLDTSNDDSYERVSYPPDVLNANYAPAHMSYDNTKFEYGGWTLIPGEGFMPRPCVLDVDTCEVIEYLNPDDYSKTIDGTTSAYYNQTKKGANVMLEWPKIYTHREEVDGVYKFRCSNVKVGDDWECWCNYNKNNEEIDHFYMSAYNGYVTSSTLYSVSGVTHNSNSQNTFSNTLVYIDGKDEGWYTEVLSDYLLMQDLMAMIGKSTNCQAVYGRGAVNITGYGVTSGVGNTKGMFWGTNANDTSVVKVFGIENPWGNGSRWLSGWVVNNDGTHLVKITRGSYDGSESEDYSYSDGNGYLTLGEKIDTSNNGYISKMITTKFGRLPITLAGSSSTYECDGVRIKSISGKCPAVIAGNTTSVSEAGPFYASLNTPNNSTIYARLSCKPAV